MTKVMIATLESTEDPEFSPQPTAKRETKIPNTEILRSCFVPKRCPGRSGKTIVILNRLIDTSMSKIGGKVMITLMIVIPKDIYGPKRGMDFARMSLL